MLLTSLNPRNPLESPHSVPRKPKCGKNYWQLTRSSKNHRKFTENSPPGGEYRGICGFLQMLQQGPGIARRADRVGVLPLAPLASFALKNYLRKLNFFHLWAHCVPGKFTENSPPGGEYRGICGFLQMLQQGPGIARRADRVGVLPLAPLASFALKNYLWKLNFFHLWAHCVPG